MRFHNVMILLARLVLSIGLVALAIDGVAADVVGDVDKDTDEAVKGKKGKAAVKEGESHDDVHRRLEKESKATLKEITRLMEKVRGSLADKKTGAATQEKQQAVVKKLEELIDALGKG